MSHFNLVVFHCVIVISLCFQSEDDKSFLVPIKVEWIWIFSAQICWQMWVLSSGILQSLRARPRKGTAARLHIYWCHREISYTEASRGKILWALCTHFRKWVFLGGRRTYNCSQICLLRRKAGKYFFSTVGEIPPGGDMSPESPPRQRLRSREDRERDTFIWAFTREKYCHRLSSATRVVKNSV